MKTQNTWQTRIRRQKRVRKTVRGVSDRPRLSVFRSAKHVYAQVIDDTQGKTLVAVTTKELATGSKSQKAHEAGVLLARRARDAGIARVVFDRGGYRFHGRVASLALGAREGGLQF